MVKGKTNQTVYIKKSSQDTLRLLSEKTRLSQSEILSEILKPLNKVLESFPECDRLVFGVYEDLTKKPKRVSIFLNPLFSGELQFQLDNTDEKINEARADLAITKEIERIAQKQKVTQK